VAEGTMNLPVEQKSIGQAVGFGNKGLQPVDLAGAWKCAELVAKSGLAPKGIQTPEAILVAAAMGAELGLSFLTSIQNVAVINGRPSVWGDAVLGLVRATGELREFSETTEGTFPNDDFAAVCRATRDNGVFKQTTEERFSIADAKKARLWGKQGPWTEYPRRMLRMRARGFVLRDLFADVLRGLRTTEEAMDIPADQVGPGKPFEVEEVREAQPEPSAPIAPAKPAQEPAQEQEEAKEPAPELPRRSRRNDVVLPGTGETVKTAGVTGETLDALEELTEKNPEAKETAEAFLKARVGYDELTYLREDEGQQLLKTLRVAFTDEAPAAPEQTEAPAEQTSGKIPISDEIPGTSLRIGDEIRTKLGRGRIEGYAGEDDTDRGPLASVSMLDGDRRGEVITFYVREMQKLEPKPAQEAQGGNGDGNGDRLYVACKGPYMNQRRPAEVCEARCPEAGNCPELAEAKAAARKKAAEALI